MDSSPPKYPTRKIAVPVRRLKRRSRQGLQSELRQLNNKPISNLLSSVPGVTSTTSMPQAVSISSNDWKFPFSPTFDFSVPFKPNVRSAAPFVFTESKFHMTPDSLKKNNTFSVSQSTGSGVVHPTSHSLRESFSPYLNHHLFSPSSSLACLSPQDCPTVSSFVFPKKPVSNADHPQDVIYPLPEKVYPKKVHFGLGSSTEDTEETARNFSNVKVPDASSHKQIQFSIDSFERQANESITLLLKEPEIIELDSDETKMATLTLSTMDLTIKKGIPTVLKDTLIVDPNQVTCSTRFWQLADTGKSELAQLEQFINQQSKKSKSIHLGLKQSATYGHVQEKVKNLTMEAGIAHKKLEIQNELIHDMIDQGHRQQENIHAASHVISKDLVRGAKENWEFFKKVVQRMQSRIEMYSSTVQSIKENMAALEEIPSPQIISKAMMGQKRVFLSLSGRVMDIHDQFEVLTKRRKL